MAPPTIARTIRVNATGSCAMSAYHVVAKPRVASAVSVGLLPGFVIPTTARPINANATGLCTTSSIDSVCMHWLAFAAVKRRNYATACRKVLCKELCPMHSSDDGQMCLSIKTQVRTLFNKLPHRLSTCEDDGFRPTSKSL